MKRKQSKLKLVKETVKRLEENQLKDAAGRYPVTAMSACQACSEFFSCPAYTWCACG